MHVVWPVLQQGCGHMVPSAHGTWRSSWTSAAVARGSDTQLSILTESAELGFQLPFLLHSPALFPGPSQCPRELLQILLSF